MQSFLSPDPATGGMPAWWTGELPPGHAVELEVYGDRVTGLLVDATGDTIRIRIPAGSQISGLGLSTAHGTAMVSLPDGAARVPVSCWVTGDLIRLQVIGPVEFLQRRVHARRSIRLPVSLAWLPADERVWHQAHSDTVDISFGGLRVAPATTVWPRSGVTVRVLLELPDGPCQLQAVVVGTTPDYGLRLEFTGTAAPEAERIRRLTSGTTTGEKLS